jgi:hypothetical protein
MNRRQIGLIIMLLASLFFIFGAFWPTYNGTKYWSASFVIIQGLYPGIPGLIGIAFTIFLRKTGAIVAIGLLSFFALYFFMWTFVGDTAKWFTGMLFFTAIVYLFGAVLCYSGGELKLGIKGL